MTIARTAGLVLFVGLAGCGKISSLLGHGDATDAGEGTTAAAGSASAGPAASAAPSASAAPAKGDSPFAVLAGFEGEIDLTAKAKSNPSPVSVNMLVKNEVVRIDIPEEALASKDLGKFIGKGKVYALLHAADKKLTLVLEGKKEAINIDLDQAAEQAKAMRHGPPGAGGGGKEPNVDPPKVVKTGKTDTVAGYPCENWDVLNADKSKLSICVGDKGASFFHLPLTGIPTEHAWALELMDGNHFPLRGIMFDRDGSENGRVEVTKLDKRTLDAAQFDVPAGYKQITLEEMLQGLGGGGAPDVPKNEKHGKHHHGRH